MMDTGDFVIQGDTLIRYQGPGGEVSVPPGVARIGLEAFLGCAGLTGVSLPEGVVEIGSRAFANCVNLARADLPESLKEMDCYAFFRCGALTRLTLPHGLTRIGHSAFSHCAGLREIRLPPDLTEIGSLTFNGCGGLTRIDLPAKLKKIGDLAFFRCDALTSLLLPEGVEQIGKKAFACCDGLALVVLPRSAAAPDKTAFYGSDPAIAAPHIPLANFPKIDRPKAIRGFAVAYLQSMPMAPEERTAYLTYIRRQRKRLYPLALRHEELLRLMIAESVIPQRDIQFLLEQAEALPNAAAREMIAAYGESYEPGI